MIVFGCSTNLTPSMFVNEAKIVELQFISATSTKEKSLTISSLQSPYLATNPIIF